MGGRPTSVIRARRSRVLAVLVGALAAAGLPALPGGTAGAAVTTATLSGATAATARHGRSLTLDDGALRVRPTATAPRVHRSWAQFDLTHSTAGGVDFSTGRVLYGAVTLDARRVSEPDFPGPFPAFHATPAWVLFFEPGASSCPTGVPAAGAPAYRTSTAAAPAVTASRRSVMVVDARTGAALVYLGVGARACTFNRVPLLEKVAEQVSVPWTGADLPAGTPVTAVTARYPGCATGFALGASGRPGRPSTFGVEVLRAYGTCAGRPRAVRVSTEGFDLVAPVRHARVGPVATGRSAF